MSETWIFCRQKILKFCTEKIAHSSIKIKYKFFLKHLVRVGLRERGRVEPKNIRHMTKKEKRKKNFFKCLTINHKYLSRPMSLFN